MGLTGLARWRTAPPNALELIMSKIARNHMGVIRGKWSVSVRSYRCLEFPKRTMFAVTTPDASYVTITEDGEMVPRTNASDGESAAERASRQHLTFVTLSSPTSLEPFLAQLGPRWGPLRQTAGPAARVQGGIHLQIEGVVFWLGSDWIVRVGNVTQAGVAGPRGIVLEAEYLPAASLPLDTPGTSQLLSDLMTSILPGSAAPDHVAAITLIASEGRDILGEPIEGSPDAEGVISPDEDLYYSETRDVAKHGKLDWTGPNRERRASYLLLRLLQNEGIL